MEETNSLNVNLEGSLENDDERIEKVIKKKRYKQRFKDSWLEGEFSPWISRHHADLDDAYCRFCEKKLTGNLNHLKRHAMTTLHRKRMKDHIVSQQYVPANYELDLGNGETQCYPVETPHSTAYLPEYESHIEIPTTDRKMNNPEMITNVNSADIQSHGLEELHIVEEPNPQNNILESAIIHTNKMDNQDQYVLSYVTSVETSTQNSIVNSMGNHITVTIEGQDPILIQSSVPKESENLHTLENMQVENCDIVINNKSKVKRPRTKKIKSSIKREKVATSKKYYRHKYSQHWDYNEEFASWLVRAPSNPKVAFCSACDKKIEGGKSHLRRHGRTPYHLKKMKISALKREKQMISNTELLLSRFAKSYSLSNAALMALPELLLKLFPGSKLCQQLSTERLETMMLVRNEREDDSSFLKSSYMDQSDHHQQISNYSQENQHIEVDVPPHYEHFDEEMKGQVHLTDSKAFYRPHALESATDMQSPSLHPRMHNLVYEKQQQISLRNSNMEDKLSGRVAIVTGASAGIGAMVCRVLIGAGMRVVGVARTEAKLKTLSDELNSVTSKGTFTAMRCDMTKDMEVVAMFKEVVGTLGPAHVVVNNAGISFNKSLLEGSTAEWRAMLDLNVVAVCLLTKLAVQTMRERGIDDGHIVNINSTAGHRIEDHPSLHFYSGTKQALRALSEGLRRELRHIKSHIRISSISPGLVETDFIRTMMGSQEQADRIYSKFEALKDEDVARSVLHVLTAPPNVEINDMIIRPTEQET